MPRIFHVVAPALAGKTTAVERWNAYIDAGGGPGRVVDIDDILRVPRLLDPVYDAARNQAYDDLVAATEQKVVDNLAEVYTVEGQARAALVTMLGAMAKVKRADGAPITYVLLSHGPLAPRADKATAEVYAVPYSDVTLVAWVEIPESVMAERVREHTPTSPVEASSPPDVKASARRVKRAELNRRMLAEKMRTPEFASVPMFPTVDDAVREAFRVAGLEGLAQAYPSEGGPG